MKGKIPTMKKTFLLILTLIVSGVFPLLSSEIRSGHDFVFLGKNHVRFLKNGWMVFQWEKKMYAHGSWNISTPLRYYSFLDQKNALRNPSEGVWEYKGIFPADKENNLITFHQTVEVNPFGLLDVSITGQSRNPKADKGSFFHIVCNMKDFAGKEFLIGNQKVKVENVQKYGTFNKVLENVELTFFHWDEKRCFKILCSGKVRIVTGSTKDKHFSVRIIPAENKSSLLFSVKFR